MMARPRNRVDFIELEEKTTLSAEANKITENIKNKIFEAFMFMQTFLANRIF